MMSLSSFIRYLFIDSLNSIPSHCWRKKFTQSMLVNAFCFLFLNLNVTRKLVIRMRLYLLASFSFFKIPILLNQCIFHWSLQLYFLVHLFWHFCYSHFIITLILLNLFYHFFWLVSSNQYIFCFSLIFVTATSTTT